jgi:hypothetical protein
MAESLPETEPRSVASLNRRLCSWEASASDETASLKHATVAVPMNRARSGKTERKRIGPSPISSPTGVVKRGTKGSKFKAQGVFV